MGHRATIAAPRDLKMPEKVNEVLAKVTDDGHRDFMDEMLTALKAAKETNDLAPVQYVVDAWWASSLFLSHEGMDDALDAAEAYGSSRQYTAEQIGELLGVS